MTTIRDMITALERIEKKHGDLSLYYSSEEGAIPVPFGYEYVRYVSEDIESTATSVRKTVAYPTKVVLLELHSPRAIERDWEQHMLNEYGKRLHLNSG